MAFEPKSKPSPAAKYVAEKKKAQQDEADLPLHLRVGYAYATERRLHDGRVEALTSDPEMSEAEKEYHRFFCKIIWEYGEMGPEEMAEDARRWGTHDVAEAALRDAEKLADLGRKADEAYEARYAKEHPHK